MQRTNMDRKVQYLDILLLLGSLVLCVDCQQCPESLQASVQPCLMVIMNAFNSMTQNGAQISSTTIMNLLCKQEVKTAMMCVFDAVKACPAIAPSVSSIPGVANMDMNTLESMCSAMIDFSAHEVLQERCPSVVAAYNYSLRLSKPANCSDVLTPDTGMDGPCTRADVETYSQCGAKVMLGISQLSSLTIGMESLTGFLKYICGSAKADVTCFLQGYEKCPNFKTNSDNAGLTRAFRAQPLKELVMTGCKNVDELEKHSQCIMNQFESAQYQTCADNATKTYGGNESPPEGFSCNYYNAMKSCLYGTVGEKCDHGVAENLYKWSNIMFDIQGKCPTSGAPMVYSSFFLMLAFFATYFLL